MCVLMGLRMSEVSKLIVSADSLIQLLREGHLIDGSLIGCLDKVIAVNNELSTFCW